jgi:hypothetical protein
MDDPASRRQAIRAGRGRKPAVAIPGSPVRCTDVALAWGALGSEGDARRQWLVAGLACDVADAFAGIAGGCGGYLPKLTSVLVTGTALSAAVLGTAALQAE